MRQLGLASALALLLFAGDLLAGEVADVVNGATLVLGDGRTLRLAGLEPAPSPAASKVLEEIAASHALRIEPFGFDRHKRLRAHIWREDGLWVQGELLRLGLARVQTSIDDRHLAGEMLAIEAAARAEGRGFWTHPQWTVRTPETALRFVDSFQIVEGRVLEAARVRSLVFLNFGPDRRTDFTVRIGAPARKLWREAGRDPLALAGKRIRVRGWLRSWDGPLIEVTHPEQIESLP